MEAQIVDGKIVLGNSEEGSSSEEVTTNDAVVEAPKGARPGTPKPASSEPKKKRFKVMINQQDSFDGKFDVPIGINGKVNLVKRGVEVVLDEDYLQVLKDAKIDQIVKNEKDEDETITVARYSFSILGEVN